MSIFDFPLGDELRHVTETMSSETRIRLACVLLATERRAEPRVTLTELLVVVREGIREIQAGEHHP